MGRPEYSFLAQVSTIPRRLAENKFGILRIFKIGFLSDRSRSGIMLARQERPFLSKCRPLIQTIKKKIMSESKVSGIVHLIEETKTYGQKGFRKRLVVLEQDNGRFTNFVPVEFVRDACDTVDEMSVGNEVEISYQLVGRKWQKDPSAEVKFFLNAEAISFKVLSASNGGAAAAGGDAATAANDAFADSYDEKDIPF